MITMEPYQLPPAWVATCDVCGKVWRDNDKAAVVRWCASHIGICPGPLS